MVAFKAYFDGKVVVPEEPVDLQPGERLIVKVERVPAEPSSLEWMAKNAISDPSLPTDGSYQHDHYLYGTPKKPPLEP